MKMISWNVNGLRACVSKNFMEFFESVDADLFSVQETKLQKGQIYLETKGYYQYWNYAEKKGYSGVFVFSKLKPLSVVYGLEDDLHNTEGRIITLEFEKFFHVTAYVPNSKEKLIRLEYRLKWEEDILKHLNKLSQTKPVIYCGDLNVAHKEIDLKNPKSNTKNPGFSNEEREAFSNLLSAGFIDSFRYFYPNLEGAYSWWSYRFKAREKNAGWRIDYFIVSENLKQNLKSAKIHSDILGSDHCPVELVIDL